MPKFLVTIDQVPGYDGAPEKPTDVEQVLAKHFRGCSVDVTVEAGSYPEVAAALIAKISAEEDTGEELLDEAVRDAALLVASVINEKGFEVQVRYLIEQIGPRDTASAVDEAIEKAKDAKHERRHRSQKGF